MSGKLNHKPPRLAEMLLYWLSEYDSKYSLAGDFEEDFNKIIRKNGVFHAKCWYWAQAFCSVAAYSGLLLNWSAAMFKNYFTITFRNLTKYKVYSFINIAGLAVGMTCCILIYLYIQDETSYDRFHENSDRIFRIDWMSDNPQTRTPHPMAQAMVRDFPEVQNAVTLSPIWGPGLTRPTISVRYKDQLYDEKGFYSADSSFFSVFSFKLLQGDRNTALKYPGSIIITKRIAEKYFRNEDPMDKVFTIAGRFELKVSGVLEDIPDNSHFHFDFLISYVTLKPQETGNYYEWEDFGHFNYIVLARGMDPEKVETKIPEWFLKYNNWSQENAEGLLSGEGGRFALTPLENIHLYSHIKWELEANGNIAYIYIFTATAVFILVIACINFMNLSTARSARRAKEVGLRKTVGANKKQLVSQFLSESVLFCMLAIVFALVMAVLILPYFNIFTDKELSLSYFYNIKHAGIILLIVLGAGFLAGSYPALYLSSFHPVQVLKGSLKSASRQEFVRKGLVIFQFAVSIVFITGTFVIYEQLDFFLNRNLGFEKEHIVAVPLHENELRMKYKTVKDELVKHPDIINAAAVSNIPGGRFNQNSIQWRESDDDISVSEIAVDYDFFTSLGIDIVEGRAFSREYSTDDSSAFILNETAAGIYEWDTAVGKTITWYDDNGDRQGKVIGVVKDFHFKSLHQQIAPALFMIQPGDFNYMLLKIRADNIRGTLGFLEKKWPEFDSLHTFSFSFLDNNLEKLYGNEQKAGQLLGAFSALAVIIACLGLYGLASFTTEQRIKEIGIRKTLGATNSGITYLLTREFIRLVFLANIIAWPAAWYMMNMWLEDFAYRINISWWSFVTSAVMAVLIALFTVGYQALKAAGANPAESLKCE